MAVELLCFQVGFDSECAAHSDCFGTSPGQLSCSTSSSSYDRLVTRLSALLEMRKSQLLRSESEPSTLLG